ncbi:MAG: phage integrase N-terminal SAM-like domain-containing protein [Candidatus Marinimicrobia bacterium]|nr:phage integrase N-terminal SAM-like domain-containing protein [Candidatus Neomarinimicrobiota bacterium]
MSAKMENGVRYKYRAATLLPYGYLERLDQKRYSKNTINIYTAYFKDFVNEFRNQKLSTLSKNSINAYILKLIKQNNISTSQQNQRINAIKFYYEKVLGREK